MKARKISIAAALLLAGGLANAALTADEINQLGTTLTPWGAEKGGNKDGTIPAWDGGLSPSLKPPGFKPKSGHWVDPYADDKPLYSITAKNVSQYADKLSDAQKEMFKRYPDTWRMDVYPTRRSVNFDKGYIERTLANAKNPNCKTIENGLGMAGCKGGMPFPIPKTAYEVLFNAQAATAKPYDATYQTMYVDSNGVMVQPSTQTTYTYNPWDDPDVSVEEYYKRQAPISMSTTLYLSPARIAGDENMTIFVSDSVNSPNRGFRYQQGVRRVRTIPETGYDFPIVASGGAQFYDDSAMFLGKMDRFNFKLLGKKEMIIPYNNYRLNETSPKEMTAVGGGHHPNPASMRWELHRVYVIEGTLVEGQRHAYSKRKLYVDEDFPKMGMSEAWDQGGKIYKGIFMATIWLWDEQTAWYFPNISYNLATGVWYYSALVAGYPGLKILDKSPGWSFFTPEGILRRSQR